MSGCDERQADAEIMAQRCDGFQAHVASALDGPFIVLFEQQCADQADNGGLIGEDTDDLAAALDLAVEPFEWVGAVYLGAMLGREAHVGQHISFGIVHQASELTDAWPGLISDLSPLLAGGPASSWAKAVPTQAETMRRRVSGMGQGIAHEVHTAALPGGAEHLGDRRFQVSVSRTAPSPTWGDRDAWIRDRDGRLGDGRGVIRGS